MVSNWDLSLFAISVAFTAFAIYQTIKGRSEEHQKSVNQILTDELVVLFRFKSLTLLVLILVISLVFSSFTLGIIYYIIGEAAVLIFFVLLLYYLILNRVLPKQKSYPMEKVFIFIATIASLLISFMFYDELAFLLHSGYWIVLFLSGFGGFVVVDKLAKYLSFRISITNKWHYAIIFGPIIFLLVVLKNASHHLLIFPDPNVESNFTSSLGWTFIALLGSLVSGFGYLLYLLKRKEEVQRAPSLIYLVLVSTLAGLLITYSYLEIGNPSEPDTNFSGSTKNFLIGVGVPMMFFVVSYSQFVFGSGQGLATRFGVHDKRFITCTMFFLIFVAFTQYQPGILSGDSSYYSAFLSLAGFFSWYGLIAGGLWLLISKTIKNKKTLALACGSVSSVGIFSLIFYNPIH